MRASDDDRRLEPDVAAAADEFWGDALDLSRVRCVNSPVARMTGRAFVTWNTIHWPGPPPVHPDDPAMRVMIHELAHCWQHQSGRRQVLRGIIEQTLYTLFGWWLIRLEMRPWYDPYDYGGPEGIASASALESFSLEAQATIVEHHWLTRGEASPHATGLARLCRQAGLG